MWIQQFNVVKSHNFGLNLHQKLLNISLEEVDYKKRGFHITNSGTIQHLEKIGLTFLDGYHAAIATADPKLLITELNKVETEWRGFAYEGAAMGLALLEEVTLGQSRHLQDFLMGVGSNHLYMVYVGIGWAMARLPWGINRYLTKLYKCQNYPDPLLGWLALDGYGFHQGYFYWRNYIQDLVRPKLSGYAGRVFDQGLGRSLWFVKGAEPHLISQSIERFSRARQADLWSGVGLACTYAGGVEEKAIRELKTLAKDYPLEVAQGSAFAAKARLRAGNLTQHTEKACQILCSVSAETAAQVTEQALKGLTATDEKPMYEQWRQRIQFYFSSGGDS